MLTQRKPRATRVDVVTHLADLWRDSSLDGAVHRREASQFRGAGGCALMGVIQVQQRPCCRPGRPPGSHLTTRKMKEDRRGVRGRSNSLCKGPVMCEPGTLQERRKFAGQSPSPLELVQRKDQRTKGSPNTRLRDRGLVQGHWGAMAGLGAGEGQVNSGCRQTPLEACQG